VLIEDFFLSHKETFLGVLVGIVNLPGIMI
jgi:hypothetical protein